MLLNGPLISSFGIFFLITVEKDKSVCACEIYWSANTMWGGRTIFYAEANTPLLQGIAQVTELQIHCCIGKNRYLLRFLRYIEFIYPDSKSI